MSVIRVLGLASGRMREIAFSEEDKQRNLMFFLKGAGITIASSCDGEGVCLKCVIQNDWPSCQLTLGEFLQRCPDGIVKVSYL